jgi:hypothetical protein
MQFHEVVQSNSEGEAARQNEGWTETQAGQAEQVSITGLGTRWGAMILLLVYALGLGSGYLVWGRAPITPLVTASEADTSSSDGNPEASVASALAEKGSVISQISIPDSYTLPVSFEDIGPQLLEVGAIDYDRFVQVYKQAGQPLSQAQLKILSEGSDGPITIDRDNAYFLLNFFWAVGLANQNPILEEGAMMQYGEDEVGRFASTGGWTIGAKPATELYSSAPIITLNPEQQARLEEVASGVYRPCCDNHTAFPDCNHGMAMLGLLELMASQDASADEMFEAAKYANAFWFPQQTREAALFFKAAKNQDFAEVDAREMVGPAFSSGSGFRGLHQWLADNGLLEQAPNGGTSCGV